MACPYVAGIAAFCLSKHAADIRSVEIGKAAICRIISTCGSMTWFDMGDVASPIQVGDGLMNALKVATTAALC